MAHMSELFIGHYASAEDASTDYDAVAAAHDSGAVGHVELAVVAAGTGGAVTIQRHDKMGGVHLTHGLSDELKAGTQEVERGAVALLVVSTEDDAKTVDTTATRATSRATHASTHVYLGDSNFGFGNAPPSDELGEPEVSSDDAGVQGLGRGPEERLT
jgi:hypothetical protein